MRRRPRARSPVDRDIRVLVVDDELDAPKLVVRVLQSCGFPIREDGAQGVTVNTVLSALLMNSSSKYARAT
jgi:hypothetical protein